MVGALVTFPEWVAREILRAGAPEILAELVEVSPTTVRRWCRGVLFPSAVHVAKLADVTGTDEAALVALVHAARLDPDATRRQAKACTGTLRRRPVLLHYRRAS